MMAARRKHPASSGSKRRRKQASKQQQQLTSKPSTSMLSSILNFVRLHGFEKLLECWAFAVHQDPGAVDFCRQPAKGQNRYDQNGQRYPNLPCRRNARPDAYQDRRRRSERHEASYFQKQNVGCRNAKERDIKGSQDSIVIGSTACPSSSVRLTIEPIAANNTAYRK